MVRALLDVNVLVALLDSDHVEHATATRWLRDNLAQGWASCPITQNGCLRVMSLPGYPNHVSVPEIAERLEVATRTRHHEFWPDQVSILDSTLVQRRALLQPRQVTDTYLLALSVVSNGRFVTFDRRVSIQSVAGATAAHLLVL